MRWAAVVALAALHTAVGSLLREGRVDPPGAIIEAAPLTRNAPLDLWVKCERDAAVDIELVSMGGGGVVYASAEGGNITWGIPPSDTFRLSGAGQGLLVKKGRSRIAIGASAAAVYVEECIIRGPCVWESTMASGTAPPAPHREAFMEGGAEWTAHIECSHPQPQLRLAVSVLTLTGGEVTVAVPPLAQRGSVVPMATWVALPFTIPSVGQGSHSLTVTPADSVFFRSAEILGSSHCHVVMWSATVTVRPVITPTASPPLTPGTSTASVQGTTPSVSLIRPVATQSHTAEVGITMTMHTSDVSHDLSARLRHTVGSAAVVVALTSAVGGSTATQATMAPLLISTLPCPVDHLPFVWHPLGLEVWGSRFIGCIVGDLALVAGVTALHGVVVCVAKCVFPAMRVDGVQGMVRFPSLSIHAGCVFYPALVLSGVKVLQHGHLVFGALVAAVVGVVFPVVLLGVLKDVKAVFTPEGKGPCEAWLTGRGAWSSFPPEDRMVDRFGVLFRFNLPTQVRFLWGMGMSFVLAAISGVDAIPCGVQRVIMAAVVLVYAVVVWRRAPFVIPRHQSSELLVCALQGASLGCAAYNFLSPSEVAVAISVGLGYLCLAVVVLNTLVDVVIVVLRPSVQVTTPRSLICEDLPRFNLYTTPTHRSSSASSHFDSACPATLSQTCRPSEAPTYPHNPLSTPVSAATPLSLATPRLLPLLSLSPRPSL